MAWMETACMHLALLRMPSQHWATVEQLWDTNYVPHPCCHHLLVKGYWYPLLHCSCLQHVTSLALWSQLKLFTKQNKNFNTATILKLYTGWMTPNFIHACCQHKTQFNLKYSCEVLWSLYFLLVPTHIFGAFWLSKSPSFPYKSNLKESLFLRDYFPAVPNLMTAVGMAARITARSGNCLGFPISFFLTSFLPTFLPSLPPSLLTFLSLSFSFFLCISAFFHYFTYSIYIQMWNYFVSDPDPGFEY